MKVALKVGCGPGTMGNEVTRQEMYAWRNEMKKKGMWSPDDGALFLPFDILAPAFPPLRKW